MSADNIAWEEVEIPRGAFVGWGSTPGQHVTGKVLAYAETGGTDFNGRTCPRLDIELTDKAASFNKDGDRTDYSAGEFVVLNCGQVSIQRAVRAAALNTGDLVKIELANLVKTEKGTVKEFSMKVARGNSAPAAAPTAAEAPF